MPSARARRRALASARPQLHPTSEPLEYALGVGGPPPGRTLLLVLGGAVGVTALLSTLAGTLVGPGFIVVALTFWGLNPPRGVVVTSNSVTVMKRSMLHGRPTTALGVAALTTALEPPGARSGRWASHAFGDEVVWLTKKEAERTVAAVRSLATTQPAKPAQPA